MSRSLESVLSGQRPRANTVGTVRVDQHGRLMPPGMGAHSTVAQDSRRFSEASIIPPPRPAPPNLKRLMMKAQRRAAVQPPPGSSWPPSVVLSPPSQTQPQPQPRPQLPPQQDSVNSNLAKMSQLARSTPQLDEYTDNRERDRERMREREKAPNVQNTRDTLIPQVRDEFLQETSFGLKPCCVD